MYLIGFLTELSLSTYSNENIIVKVHSAKSKYDWYWFLKESTLSSITARTLNRISISKERSNILPAGVSASNIIS